MNLSILVPSQVFLAKKDVTHLVVETSQGAWGFLPHRRDCLAALVPGVLTFKTQSEGVVYVAVDIGVLVKTGADVHISVRRALVGTDLAHLRETVAREYAVLDQTEREVRNVNEKLENGFLRRMVALHRD